MEIDDQADWRWNITLGMVEGKEEHDIFLINESQETLEAISLQSNSTYFDDDDKPIKATSRVLRFGTLAPGTAVRIEKRDIYDMESHIGYTFTVTVRGTEYSIVLGTPPDRILHPYHHKYHRDQLPVVGKPGYYFPPRDRPSTE